MLLRHKILISQNIFSKNAFTKVDQIHRYSQQCNSTHSPCQEEQREQYLHQNKNKLVTLQKRIKKLIKMKMCYLLHHMYKHHRKNNQHMILQTKKVTTALHVQVRRQTASQKHKQHMLQDLHKYLLLPFEL